MSAMGMMHEGYFVGRKELIAWVRQYFDPGFAKIEDLASGAVYCQVIDNIYPGALPMSKVKMSAKTEVDFIHNFKILQTSFSKKKIDRFIDVDKLTKRSFQYNMEFMQFMKCYWDMHAPGGVPPEGLAGAPLAEAAAAPSRNEPPSAPPRKEAKVAPGLGGAKRAPAKPAGPSAAAAPGASVKSAAASAASALEIAELKLSVENLERERDFYYTKLREVEIMCQGHEEDGNPFLDSVLEILYKTDDAEEFVTPEEGAEAQAVAA